MFDTFYSESNGVLPDSDGGWGKKFITSFDFVHLLVLMRLMNDKMREMVDRSIFYVLHIISQYALNCRQYFMTSESNIFLSLQTSLMYWD